MAEEQYTMADAEAAGWRIVHTADPSAETANAEIWRAEKYESLPGRPGAFVDLQATTEEKLAEAIRQREQQFSVSDEGPVIVPRADAAEGDEVDLSDESTLERITDAQLASARQNDVLVVLSNPEDPDSEPRQVVLRGGQEVDSEVLSEPATPNSATEAEVLEANQAALDEATGLRDDAETPEDADGPEAAAQVADARHDALQDAHDHPESAGASGVGDPGDSGNDPETAQPEAGEATDASDSEQQEQVRDSEAASSDAVGSNDDDFLATNLSQPEEAGPDSDAEATPPAPNAGQGVTGSGVPAADVTFSTEDGDAPQTDA